MKILAGAVTSNLRQAAVPVQVEALACLAELHVRLGDPDSARRPVEIMELLDIPEEDRVACGPALRQARQLLQA
ncbi:hypothetical protein [Arthrobacter sulfonylureivorans]|uniref:HEAT repeat domain-containing protein n=1 Tax=Arthrobacter sulfonylureivorans TaxID=2486855 RepID=A0ABY3W5L9_9MICC|nr:hypothetical protein [Arthrobacter sulfonylureivorans]UNK44298.1 hypothetical protein MNQ99_09770 [Arthrobacter sulfonylureivorans]